MTLSFPCLWRVPLRAVTAETSLRVLAGLAMLICGGSVSCSDGFSTSVSARLAEAGDSGVTLLIDTVRGIDAAAKADAAYSSSNAGALENEVFVDLYRHPYRHFPVTLKIVESGYVDGDALTWLVRLSQCLETPDYLVLGKAVYRRFEDGGMDEHVLAAYVLPELDWGVPFAMQYQDEQVRAFLQGMFRSEKVGEELRETIGAVLSGEQARFVAAHRVAGETIPVLSCGE